AREELQKRLARIEPADCVHVSTFHALGLGILGEARGERPSLSPMADDPRLLQRFIRDRVRAMLADSTARSWLIGFLATNLDEDDALTAEATLTRDAEIRNERARGLTAINGTKVKSRQEVQIANW